LTKNPEFTQNPRETMAQVWEIVFSDSHGADIAVNRAECNYGQQHRRISVTGWGLKECA
jgi:hypothetical protein